MMSKEDYMKKCAAYYDFNMQISNTYPHGDGVQPEKSYYRDIGYSLWHRSLSSDCQMIDIDCVEIRNNKPVLICDLKPYGYDINRYSGTGSLGVYKQVANALDVPFMVISPKPDMSRFVIHDIDTHAAGLKSIEVVGTEQEMRGIIEYL